MGVSQDAKAMIAMILNSVDDATLEEITTVLETTFRERRAGKAREVIKKLNEAVEFANKLGFEICYLDDYNEKATVTSGQFSHTGDNFNEIWL